MDANKVEAFIFDLDGVITDTAEYHYIAWKALANEVGIHFDREFNEQLKGVSRIDSLELILAHGGMEDRFSAAEKEELANRKNQHYQKLIQNISRNDILPGITELIEELKEKGIKIGLASASKNAFTVMNSLGLTESFGTIVDAREISKGKPDPEIFLTAAQQLQVEPKNCIGIEDSASGIEAINAAGMFSVGVGDAKSLHHADWIVPSTSELKLSDILSAFAARK